MTTAKPERPPRPAPAQSAQSPQSAQAPQTREKRPKKRTSTGASKYSWLFNPFTVGLIGALVGSLITMSVMTMLTKESTKAASRLHQQTLQHRNNLAGMEGINRIGGSVKRDLSRSADEADSVFFSEARMTGIGRRTDLRLAVNYASILPGIKKLNFEDSVADNTVMNDIRQNFDSLDSLNIAGTKVTELETIKPLGLTELNLDRTPIDYYELQTLGDFSSLSRLTIGPPAFEVDGKTPYQYTKEVREQLLADILALGALTELTVYDFALDAPTRNALREKGVEIYERKR